MGDPNWLQQMMGVGADWYPQQQAVGQIGQMQTGAGAPRPQARIQTTVTRLDPYTGQTEVVDSFRGRPHLTPGDMRGYRKVKKLAQRAARVRRKYTTYSRAKKR